MPSKSEESKDPKEYKESKGDEDGEGESYDSSCTCSSCLREKNADNGMSLKLSQYSYKPTYGDFKRNETEVELSTLNNSGYRDVINTSMYGEKSGFAKGNNESAMDRSSIGDISNSDAQKNYFKNTSKGEYPDNLNNGKFKMMMG
uniref:Uncharacterized protein n=1 Tax=Euplotes crassus TaxID=5936 RepID=A0A7S3KCL8_EUPCR|mmetsp:Transcript_21114/g.20804  ORF Transcript_21114/g.20804 Transcript_21114/m.20804 type:complete len:145 (+) Transcript_21114:701-1135(+)